MCVIQNLLKFAPLKIFKDEGSKETEEKVIDFSSLRNFLWMKFFRDIFKAEEGEEMVACALKWQWIIVKWIFGLLKLSRDKAKRNFVVSRELWVLPRP